MNTTSNVEQKSTPENQFEQQQSLLSKSYGIGKNGVDMKIALTENESRICTILQKVSDHISAERPDLPGSNLVSLAAGFVTSF
ncbi:unnamed protein product [Absidia cylindrospora]